jgi:hypothetical protein
MVDKAMTIPREKCGNVFGRLEDKEMPEITRALAVFLGIAQWSLICFETAHKRMAAGWVGDKCAANCGHIYVSFSIFYTINRSRFFF